VATTYQDSPVTTSSSLAGVETPIADESRQRMLHGHTQRTVAAFERSLNQSFMVIDPSTGNVFQPAAEGLTWDVTSRLALLEEIARRGRPEIVDETSPLLMVAIPLSEEANDPPLVAISLFLTEPVRAESEVRAAAMAFGAESGPLFRWAQARIPWHPQALMQMSQLLVEKSTTQLHEHQLKRQVAEISSHLLNTFEEITLLHRLTEQLSLARSVVTLCELSVRWLSEVIPAKCVAIKLNSVAEANDRHALGDRPPEGPMLINYGDCPLDAGEIDRFIERLGPHVATEPLVLNRSATSSPTWFYPTIRELISVPIREGDHLFGWLLAMNHTGAGEITNSEVEFGTVEASLMSSVATILGIHGGNIALYQEQADLFASVVRALTSAIDAKDPYTCGHSDRVARLSVCLARRIGCTDDELDTIYLSGLLHDIGKIGIDDHVLRKPGALTAEELEHIKTHPQLGFKILNGVKQLDKVLPVVLHHHEAWDGSGYPAGLKGEECPRLARIVAVADSIDAMSSDRPYRRGIPDEKLDSILRGGAGRQWDAKVIDAVFQVRDELRNIGHSDREPIDLEVGRWEPTQLPAATAAE
jgi:HD-GYP domain-containing protein (c-di-GMP phosphodiesterase class II)